MVASAGEGEKSKAAKGPWAQPLRLHISVVIVLLLMGISLPLMWLPYDQGKASAIAAAHQQMRLLSQHAIERYRAIFGDGLAAITLASAGDTFLAPPPAGLEPKIAFLSKALASSPYIDSVYAGYATGSFIQVVSVDRESAWKAVLSAPDGAEYAARIIDGEGAARQSAWRFYGPSNYLIEDRVSGNPSYNPTTRPWYKAASRSADPVAVGPYTMATTGMLGLTVAVSMEKESGVVLGADVVLEALGRLLSREAISKHSNGYVFDDRGRLIVHSDKQIMVKVLAALGTRLRDEDPNFGDPVLAVLRGIVDRPDHPTDGAIEFVVQDSPYVAEIVTMGNADLIKRNTIVIAAPVSDFTGPSIELLRTALLISAALLALGIALSLFIAELVSRSLASLTADARSIGDLEFHAEEKVLSHVAEINTLAVALSAARKAIGTFALYVPRELVRRIVASGQADAANAVRQEVTVLFTDIRDFTTISESRSPEEVVALLSTYFEVMNGIVERHNGVIVQYLGDSIYAMWNAPEPDADHVNDACRCTLALKAAIDELNQHNRANGLPELATRFGIHTGIAVVGNVGARSRRQYTAMGDTVNVASRLEGINKEFGTSILVSRAVHARAAPGFRFRALGLAQAKGRHERIEVFELTGAASPADGSDAARGDASGQQTASLYAAPQPLLQ